MECYIVVVCIGFIEPETECEPESTNLNLSSYENVLPGYKKNTLFNP